MDHLTVEGPIRGRDLHEHEPLPCVTCPIARGSDARWQVEFERFGKEAVEVIRWQVCHLCLGSIAEVAITQSHCMKSPIISLLAAA